MGGRCNEICFTYSMNKLSETARTFRRLSEAYDSAYVGEESDNPSFKRQLFLVANILDDCIQMQSHTVMLPKDVIRGFVSKCLMMGIRVRNVNLVETRNGRKEFVFQARTLGKGCIPERKLRQAVAQTFEEAFFANEDNRLIVTEEYGQFIYYQEERFKVVSGVARHNKENEQVNGDNFLITKLNCGKMVAALSDGCGSGQRAYVESRMVIELMENCIDAGFEERTAIDLINSAYIGSGGIGNPVTMDMAVIDRQAGLLNCIKLGAVSTFIKRDGWVEIIKSTTLPLGVLETCDYDCTTKKLYDGDYVIMITDGVLDNLSGVNKEEMMVEIIDSVKKGNPKQMAGDILAASLSRNDNEAFDDCTVMVLGMFDTYEN